MSLKDFNFKVDYYKTSSDLRREFYIPCLENSVSYDRTTGYFSSSIYTITWSGIRKFIANAGKMRIICSPFLSSSDIDAISDGYRNKGVEEIEKAIALEIQTMFQDEISEKPSRALACLVALGIVELKIAVPNKGNEIDAKRLFHDKVGIFTDVEGNSVGFKGSINETYKGLYIDGNIESIDVYPNWIDNRDRERLNNSKHYFESLWTNTNVNVTVFDFPNVSRELFVSYANQSIFYNLLDELTTLENNDERWFAEKSDNPRKPRKHQIESLDEWIRLGRKGILEHATGSGKTYTALCAIRRSLDSGEVVLVLVPSKELLYQWEKDIRRTFENEDVSIFICGDSNSEWRKGNNLTHWSAKSQTIKKIIISSMDTAASDEFTGLLVCGSHLFIVADEVHRLGSPFRRKLLNVESGARLGLSATPIRYGDPEGTGKILTYFGGIIQPPYTLKDAIDSGVLTKYFYYPNLIQLSSYEQTQWTDITMKISRILAIKGSVNIESTNLLNDPVIKNLLIQRSRIVKNASGKLVLANKIIKENYKKGQRWIVYCDNQTQLKAVLDTLIADDYVAYEYHSEMEGDRSETLKYFSINGGILVSIKCLDEGVDIPETTHALILASSQNPREFIQRRGRILRKSTGKHFAYLYDAIVAPNIIEDDSDSRFLSIIDSELARAIQFGEWAENPSSITYLRNIAIDYGVNLNKAKEGGIEDESTE